MNDDRRGTARVLALLGALGLKLGRSRQSEDSRRSHAPRSASAKSAPSRADAAGVVFDPNAALPFSPGRDGSGATRDLSQAEIARLQPSYAPQPDGDPDPGEIVWTWVPYVENDGRGKDRPVLIIARIDASTVAGCYLSTKQHAGFVSIGTGAWDGEGRESFLSPERLLRITDAGMRREGHVLPRARFDVAVRAVTSVHGFSRP